jgi:hypothetical protein
MKPLRDYVDFEVLTAVKATRLVVQRMFQGNAQPPSSGTEKEEISMKQE